MKTVSCPYCHNKREVEDKIVLSICKYCQIEMIEVKRNENKRNEC